MQNKKNNLLITSVQNDYLSSEGIGELVLLNFPLPV
jgi:hypothetical protein